MHILFLVFLVCYSCAPDSLIVLKYYKLTKNYIMLKIYIYNSVSTIDTRGGQNMSFKQFE